MEKYLYIYSEEIVMGEETIAVPFPNGLGTAPFEIADFTYSVSRHGVPMISATIKAPYSLLGKWNHRQFVMFRGVRYNITEIPSLKRTNANGYEQYEVQMYPEWNVVTKTYFYDVVDSTVADSAEKYYSDSTSVKFFGTLTEFVARLKASFKKSGIYYGVEIKNTLLGDERVNEVKEFTGDNMTLLDALKKAFEVWGVPFYYDGGTFVFGFYKNDLDVTVEYGRDKELIAVEKNNAHANIITRATGVGSEQNIPYYYPNDTELGDISYSLAVSKGGAYVDITEGVDYEVPDKNRLATALKESDTFHYFKKEEHINIDVQEAYFTNSVNSISEITDNWKKITPTFDNNNKPSVVATNVTSIGTNDKYHSFRFFFRVSIKGSIEFSFGAWYNNDTKLLFSDSDSDFSVVDLYKFPDDQFNTVEGYKKSNTIPTNYVVQSWLGRTKKKSYKVTDTSATYAIEFRKVNIAQIMSGRNWEVTPKPTEYTGLFKIHEASVNKFYAWYSEKTKKRADFDTLREIGIAYDEKDIDMRLKFDVLTKHPYQSRLMPSVFTRGYAFDDTVGNGVTDVERFYDATNGLYPDGDGSALDFQTPYNGKNRSEKVYEYDDIKPEIKGVVNADGQIIGEIAAVAYDYDDNDGIKGSGSDGTSYQHPYFYAKLHKTDSANNMGFNLFNYALASEPMTLQITSGSLAGCSFKVQVVEVSPNKFGNPVLTDASGNLKADSDGNVSYLSCLSSNTSQFVEAQQDTKQNEVWVALLKEDSTFGVIMPNVENGFKLKAGDTFNIININLPKEYILQAEQRLDAAIVRDMQTDNMERFNFAIDFSRIYLAEDYDENELNDKAGLYSTLDEASRIMVYTGDKNADGSKVWVYQYVESYTYECKGSEMLPKISLSLVNSIVSKESVAETIARQSRTAAQGASLWQQALAKSQSTVLRTGNTLAAYGIGDAYITDDGEIVLGNRSIKPIVTDYGGSRSDVVDSGSIWAELTKVDKTKVIDDSHISENIARRDDLKWRSVTKN